MRPRDAFVAQVLQFQAEIDDIERSQAGRDAAKELEAGLRQLMDVAGAVASKGSAGDGEPTKDETDPYLRDAISRLLATAANDADQARPAFVELPPAGFVRGTGKTPETVRRLVEDRLGCPGVVNRVCRCAPGDVGRLFEAAQHRDRTRTDLSPAFDEEHDLRAIDVYVPTRRGAPVFDWVLFTRAESVQCEEAETAPALDEVEVVHEVAVFEGPPNRSPLGFLQYPQSTWAVPDNPKVFAAIQDLIARAKGEFTLRAQVRSEERRPLGYLRAALLAGPFVEGQPSTSPPVETTVTAGENETITLVTQGDVEVRAVEVPKRAAAKAVAEKAVALEEVPATATASRAVAASRNAATKKAAPADPTRASASGSTAGKAATKKGTTTNATTKRARASRGTR
jgi:hypothetical protein